MLLSYEDETQKWHKIDINLRELKDTIIIPDFEGTLDNKAIKFKVLSVPKDGERAILKYGDDSDWHVEEGIHFPPIPPASTESRLPSLFFNTQVRSIPPRHLVCVILLILFVHIIVLFRSLRYGIFKIANLKDHAPS